MDGIAVNQRASGQTPEVNAQRALDAVRHAYAGEVPADVTIHTIGDFANEQVVDLIADLLLLVDVSGEDVERVLRLATMHYEAERD